jgi:hypothetical protein
MKFTSLALLALVGGVSAGKPQLSVRIKELCIGYIFDTHDLRAETDVCIWLLILLLLSNWLPIDFCP